MLNEIEMEKAMEVSRKEVKISLIFNNNNTKKPETQRNIEIFAEKYGNANGKGNLHFTV